MKKIIGHSKKIRNKANDEAKITITLPKKSSNNKVQKMRKYETWQENI